MHLLCQRDSKSKQAIAGLAALLLASTGIFTPVYAGGTATPIKRVIVIIGENRSFDHVYATYQPVTQSDHVLNLLSKKIVKADGSPGPNYGESLQYQAYDYKIYN